MSHIRTAEKVVGPNTEPSATPPRQDNKVLVDRCCWICADFDSSGGNEYGYSCTSGWVSVYVHEKEFKMSCNHFKLNEELTQNGKQTQEQT